MKDKKWLVPLTGACIGAAAVLLTLAGNPGNMGFCIACFLRDIAGAWKLHTAGAVQYFRPEIVGLALGSLLISLMTKEFKPRGGSSPVTRFVLGMLVMVGALMFLGCPLRMMLRIGGGDVSALGGLAGFAGGIYIGTLFIKKGFSLRRAYDLPKAEGLLFPVLLTALFCLSLFVPGLFAVSEAGAGPGALHAAMAVSLGIGLLAGALCQRSRFCTVAAGRDAILFGDLRMLTGFAAVILVCTLGNVLLGKFRFSAAGQPVAHTDLLWNALGMLLVGWASVLLGGCPLRQLILSGEGNADAAVTVLGYIAGAAFCHNLGLASSAQGPAANGKIAVIAGLVLVCLIGLMNTKEE